MTKEDQKLNWYAIMESGSMTAVHNLREYITKFEGLLKDCYVQAHDGLCDETSTQIEALFGGELAEACL